MKLTRRGRALAWLALAGYYITLILLIPGEQTENIQWLPLYVWIGLFPAAWKLMDLLDGE